MRDAYMILDQLPMIRQHQTLIAKPHASYARARLGE